MGKNPFLSSLYYSRKLFEKYLEVIMFCCVFLKDYFGISLEWNGTSKMGGPAGALKLKWVFITQVFEFCEKVRKFRADL